MAEYTTRIRETQDAVLDAIKQADDFVVSTVSTWSERAGELIPEVEIPFTDQLPDPVELSNLYFRFVGELVKVQQAYSANLLKAMAPVTGKLIPAAKPRKSTPKAA